MIFDTHAHYSDEQFDKDRDELLWGMEDEGVGTIVEIGASMESSREAIRLAEQYPFVYASVGVHPDHVGELNEETFGELGRMCSHGKVRAVGEIGLDYHWDRNQERFRNIGLSGSLSWRPEKTCRSIFTAGTRRKIQWRL